VRVPWEGLQLDREVKRDFQSPFHLPVQSPDFQNDYLFKLLGTPAYASSSGAWSKQPLELYGEGSSSRTLETLHLYSSKR